MNDRVEAGGAPPGATPASAASSPLSVFCGKGGVGKTTLAFALGLALARSGRRTLVVTSHPLPELALTLSLEGLQESDPDTAARLFVVHIDPREVLAEAVRAQIPSTLIARRVLTSRIYNNLIEIAPGIKELAFLSRLRDVAHRDHEAGGHDHVVWDAPATGHFLEILRVMRQFDTFLTGPFARRGRELSRFFGYADLRLYPVTTLEEMAIDEVLELLDALTGELGLERTRVMLNLVSPLLDDPALEAVPGDLPAGVAFVLERLAVERRHERRVRGRVGAACLPIVRVAGRGSDLALLDRLAPALAPLVEAAP